MSDCKVVPKLKKCPFCGTFPKWKAYRRTNSKHGHTFRVLCDERTCDISPATCHYESLEEAVNVWNKRSCEACM